MTTLASTRPLAAALEEFLTRREPNRSPTVATCRPVTGGYSRLTVIADVSWSDGLTERLVLRADPPAGTGVFDSDRDLEWAVTRWLYGSAHASIPQPRYYDETGELFGTKCIITDFVAGPTLQSLAADPGQQERAAEMFVRTIAAVHRTPLDDRPQGLSMPSDSYTYLDAMADVYLRVEREIADSSPVLRYAAAIMRSRRPPPVPLALVHGDCQPGNVLVTGGDTPVVIDWEFAHVGDPREDLGYYRQIPIQPNFYLADPAGFLARYRELAGWSEEQLNPAVVDYFLLVGIARLLAQILRACECIGGRDRRGGLAAYLISAVSLQYDLFLQICKRLDRSGWGAR